MQKDVTIPGLRAAYVAGARPVDVIRETYRVIGAAGCLEDGRERK